VFRHLTIEQHGDVALLRIDRPPANALDLELLEEGARAQDELAAASPGAVVITGRDGFFSAGVDLQLAPTLDEEAQRQMAPGSTGCSPGGTPSPDP
jgi:enoyl-CoA hydratase/carnithine racemase